MTDQRPHPSPLRSLTRTLRVAILLSLLTGGCAMIEQHDSATDEPGPVATAPRSESPPDPFAVIEEATRDLGLPESTRPKSEIQPSDLWSRVVERFAFAECPEGSRAGQWARWYGDRHDYMDRVFNRARPWLHDIVDELEHRGLPGELALLPIVESAYDPFAYSHGRAAGAWQFLSSTARDRGLEINGFYDGRRDVWASTRAALDYLTYLHDKFDDWNLALAAYNGGQGRVMRAIRRSGKDHPRWHELRLPRETLGYIPKLNGLACLFSDPERYHFRVPVWDDRPQIALVALSGPIDIVALSVAAELDIAQLVVLNPGLNGHITPPGGPHHLIVPASHAERIEAAIAELASDSPGEQLIAWRSVEVRPGDTLSHIAARHGTSVRQLREANGLQGDLLRVGQKLRIAADDTQPVDPAHADRYAELTRLHQRLLPTRRFQHRVRPGENLWVIARRYQVTVADLRRWNGLGNSTLIHPGKRLIVHMSQPGAGGHAGPTRYVVRRGDSLWTIARRHDVTVRDLVRWNAIDPDTVLKPGQELTIHADTSA
ncbi:MAG: LysM peptidoglycan-binding domain-containing protein [Pseudomonadota bacterium]|nr:MAG: LysM peptidoglycan-binding domain-containing protein [Pseudomonadota bacterium]